MAEPKKPTRTKKPTGRTGIHRPKRPRLPEPRYLDWRTFDPSMFAKKDGAMIEEMLTYRDHLKELLRDEGKYVVIKGREVIGVYAERDDALDEAIARFGSEPVFVKQIASKEPFITMGGILY
jgi:hypothetical protein